MTMQTAAAGVNGHTQSSPYYTPIEEPAERMFTPFEALGIFELLKESLLYTSSELSARQCAGVGRLLAEIQFSLDLVFDGIVMDRD